MLEVEETEIRDVKILVPKRFGDSRGFFSQTYTRNQFADVGVPMEFVQDNQSLSASPNVVRGLHWQTAPFAQDKLVRVLRGAILDVALDIRRDSPTFRKHVIVRLDAENWRQVFVPVGFAHGFVTLEPNTEVLYKVSRYYSREHERGIRWNDPGLEIDWGIGEVEAVLSDRDREQPLFENAVDLF